MSKVKKLILLIGDIVVLYVSLAIALLIRYQNIAVAQESFGNHVGPFSAIFALWILSFYWNDLYRPKAFGGTLWLMKAFARAVFIATLTSIAALYLFPGFFVLTPRANLFILSAVFFFLAYFWRAAASRAMATGALNVVILGDSPLIEEAVRFIEHNPHADYRVARRIARPNERDIEALPELIRAARAEVVVVPRHLVNNVSLLHAIYRLLPLEVSVIPFSDFYETLFEKEPLKELEENWFIENISTRRPVYESVKRGMDIAIALAVSAVLALPALLIALLVKLTSHGPMVYAQKRVGKNGAPFTLYKFRTMHHNAQGALWTETNDIRVTRLGNILRFTHLDEIPQLWNIIKGDIALVGPRPERVELAAQYERFPYYEIRHVVKPGLTGWAQVSFRPSASFEEAYEKLCYDIYYIKNRSLFLDLVIFLRTVKYLFTSYTK